MRCDRHKVDLKPGTSCPKCKKAFRKKYAGRTCWVGAPEVFGLDHACLILHQAFGEMTYLVGSATLSREFRDVDLRMIFDDDKWKMLFGDHQNGQVIAFWSLLCTAVSEYLSKRTGLKIDFQIQRRSSVTPDEWAKWRNPIGMFISQRDPPWMNPIKNPGEK